MMIPSQRIPAVRTEGGQSHVLVLDRDDIRWLCGFSGSVARLVVGLGLGRLAACRRCPIVANPFLHLLARLERHDVLGLHGNRLSGPRVAGQPGLALLDLEDAEVPQFDPPVANQGLDQGLECPLHEHPGAKLGKIDLFRDRPDDVFLGHGSGSPTAADRLDARGTASRRTGNESEA